MRLRWSRRDVRSRARLPRSVRASRALSAGRAGLDTHGRRARAESEACPSLEESALHLQQSVARDTAGLTDLIAFLELELRERERDAAVCVP